jgi:hypothetical protein
MSKLLIQISAIQDNINGRKKDAKQNHQQKPPNLSIKGKNIYNLFYVLSKLKRKGCPSNLKLLQKNKTSFATLIKVMKTNQ